MSAKEILAELPLLSAQERAELAQALRDLADQGKLPSSVNPPPARELPQAGLHEGAWEVADDFDDPLPDEFWFGKKDED